ncbi:hypothetical protein J4X63_25075, partial [Escherichia coli]
CYLCFTSAINRDTSVFDSVLSASTAALTTSERFTLPLPETISAVIRASMSFRFSSKKEILTGFALLTTDDLSDDFLVLSRPAVPPLINAASSRGEVFALFLTE